MEVSYTPMYKDSGGMGMVMSVSLGVFDQMGLVGVAGTDITLQSMLEKGGFISLGLKLFHFDPLSLDRCL